MKLFCAGVGVEHPDATNGLAPHEEGRAGAVPEERRQGRRRADRGCGDGISLAQSKDGPAMKLTLAQHCSWSVAKQVPGRRRQAGR